MNTRTTQGPGYVLLLLLIIVSTVNSEEFQAKYHPTIEAVRITEPIKIDGKIDEEVWKTAASLDNFCETSPGDQIKPPVESKALVAYDDDNLYVVLIAYDDPSTIRTSYSDRDNIFRDDYMGVMIDTYGDNSWGYELFVNPYGVQGDLRIEANGGEDISFNMIWESKGIITQTGYQVEIAIPFASLRFPDKEIQDWRFNIWRDHQRDMRRRYSWAAFDRDNSCMLCQWGYLTGIKGIKSATNIEILPNIIAFQSGERELSDYPKSDYINSDLDGDASMNIRYGLSSNSSVELSLNPDFSQVESYASRIDVNSNFALFYSESRPFFQEGRELFSTPINTAYTRSINDPRVAAKFTGKFGKTSVAFLSAFDENTPLIIPLQQQSIYVLAEESYSNIVRVKHSLKDDSHIGLMVTDRRVKDFGESDSFSGGYGNIFALDGVYRFAGKYRFRYQFLYSSNEEVDDNGESLIDTSYANGHSQTLFDSDKHTVGLDGEKYDGHSVYLNLDRSSSKWNLHVVYREFSPTYRAQNGFITQNDRRMLDVWNGMTFRPNNNFIVWWEPSLDLGRVWSHGGVFNPLKFNNSAYDEWVRLALNFRFIGQTNLNMSYLNSRERYGGVLFSGISRMSSSVSTNFTELFNGGASINFGKSIYRSRNNPEMGNMVESSIWLTVKPTKRMLNYTSLNYARMNHRDDYMEKYPTAEENIYSGYILRNRLNYQFTRELFLRLVVEYNDFSENVKIEPLLTYKINPFTKFYVGMYSIYKNYYPIVEFDSGSGQYQSINGIDSPEYGLSSTQFFAKFQYLFRL